MLTSRARKERALDGLRKEIQWLHEGFQDTTFTMEELKVNGRISTNRHAQTEVTFTYVKDGVDYIDVQVHLYFPYFGMLFSSPIESVDVDIEIDELWQVASEQAEMLESNAIILVRDGV